MTIKKSLHSVVITSLVCFAPVDEFIRNTLTKRTDGIP